MEPDVYPKKKTERATTKRELQEDDYISHTVGRRVAETTVIDSYMAVQNEW